jgi:hypothetical protein
MRADFISAANNALGANSPTYDQIKHGYPSPVLESVSSSRPIPHAILRAVAYQESHWLQFANTVNDPDNTYACTLLGYDPGGTCGYGLMQITDCMSGGCGWFTPSRVAGELKYNLGTGANMLIQKWNYVPFVGNNDHTYPEQWYFAVTAYNSWGTPNDPNSSAFLPDRPPFGESNYANFSYPYQEIVWGWMANPGEAHPDPIPGGWHWLWRPTRIATIPRGIFGLSGNWSPPNHTSKPISYLIAPISVISGSGPAIHLHNTTSQVLAADVALYNQDHTFNRWWLGAPPSEDHEYPYLYIRLNPDETRDLSLSDVFHSWESFTGYARINASEGVDVNLRPPDYPNKVFLPLVTKDYGSNCYQAIANGGFEEFTNGKPNSWTISSAESYPLADSTWFANGHYGAYLGGYDAANDTLRQYIYIPSNATSARLTYNWYIRSQEMSGGSAWDYLYVRLRDMSGNLVATLSTHNDNSTLDEWFATSYDLSSYANQSLLLSFESSNDSVSNPTSFFVDDVSLYICTP